MCLSVYRLPLLGKTRRFPAPGIPDGNDFDHELPPCCPVDGKNILHKKPHTGTLYRLMIHAMLKNEWRHMPVQHFTSLRLATVLPLTAALLMGCSQAEPPQQTERVPEVGVYTVKAQALTLPTDLPARTSAYRV